MSNNVKRGPGRPIGSYDDENSSVVGRFLGEARSEKGVSLKSVANRLGVSAQFICNIERGRAPLPAKYVAAISDFLCLDRATVAAFALQKTKVYQDLEKSI
jgi:transcriptional regulator with XRE-family HTH domain